MTNHPERLSRLRKNIEEKVEEIDRRLTVAEEHVRERDEAAKVTPLCRDESAPSARDEPEPEPDDQI